MKLSIITINLNNRTGLLRTIESVIHQTFTDYEYIVIDGGSTDGSVGVIKEFTDKITYWVSEPDKGIYNAMNKGTLQARGEYLQFLNSGDWLVDDMVLEKVFSVPRSADIVYGHLNLVNPGEIKVHKALNEEELSLAYFFNDTIAHPSSFLARRLFSDCLYDENLKIAADKKFLIEKIILQNCSIQQIDLVLVNFNTEGISHNASSREMVKSEHEKIFSQIIPHRIVKDYEIILSVINSPMLKCLPDLDTKSKWFQKLVVAMIGILINTYRFFRPNK